MARYSIQRSVIFFLSLFVIPSREAAADSTPTCVLKNIYPPVEGYVEIPLCQDGQHIATGYFMTDEAVQKNVCHSGSATRAVAGYLSDITTHCGVQVCENPPLNVTETFNSCIETGNIPEYGNLAVISSANRPPFNPNTREGQALLCFLGNNLVTDSGITNARRIGDFHAQCSSKDFFIAVGWALAGVALITAAVCLHKNGYTKQFSESCGSCCSQFIDCWRRLFERVCPSTSDERNALLDEEGQPGYQTYNEHVNPPPCAKTNPTVFRTDM